MNVGLALGTAGMFGFVAAFALVMSGVIDRTGYLVGSALAFVAYAASIVLVSTFPTRPRAMPPSR